MIVSFRDSETAALFTERKSRIFSAIAKIALRKLDQIEAATRIEDLRVPPGNRLEPLRGTREGQHSVRINDQFRVCFFWRNDGAHDVEIVDYH